VRNELGKGEDPRVGTRTREASRLSYRVMEDPGSEVSRLKRRFSGTGHRG